MQETWVQSLGWEDPLEKGMASHSSIPAWNSLELYRSQGLKESDTTERLSQSSTEVKSVLGFLWLKHTAQCHVYSVPIGPSNPLALCLNLAIHNIVSIHLSEQQSIKQK